MYLAFTEAHHRQRWRTGRYVNCPRVWSVRSGSAWPPYQHRHCACARCALLFQVPSKLIQTPKAGAFGASLSSVPSMNSKDMTWLGDWPLPAGTPSTRQVPMY
jgi:hypothetical protein